MIVVKLLGGLGNQLFQYAFARYLADANNTEVYLEDSFYATQSLRKVELNYFNVKTASLSNYQKFVLKRYLSLRWFFLKKISRYKITKEESFQFHEPFKKRKGDLYLIGYWQSEKYFIEIADMIREEIAMKDPMDTFNMQTLSYITSHTSVSIHVRRTDYLTNTTANSVHGICDIPYYDKAIEIIKNKINNPHFIIFSDDPQWCRENIKTDSPMIFIDHNTQDQNYIDIILMSKCKHHIIANSSFSWWGAWLNASTSKIVIAPQKWFVDPKRYSEDIIPYSWIKI